MRTERVNNAVYFNISKGDDMEVTQTTDSGVQANTQTSSSGVQANTQTSSSGVQTARPRATFEAGVPVKPRTRTAETQATEDKSGEIEK